MAVVHVREAVRRRTIFQGSTGKNVLTSGFTVHSPSWFVLLRATCRVGGCIDHQTLDCLDDVETAFWLRWDCLEQLCSRAGMMCSQSSPPKKMAKQRRQCRLCRADVGRVQDCPVNCCCLREIKGSMHMVERIRAFEISILRGKAGS